MKRCKQDGELANTSPQSIPSKEPNPETLEAIREGTHSSRRGSLVASTTAPMLSIKL